MTMDCEMSEMIDKGRGYLLPSTNDTIRKLFTDDKERYKPLTTAKINCSTNLKAFPKGGLVIHAGLQFFSIY